MNIEYRTFYNCASLTSLTLPEGLTSIGEEAFAECGKLIFTVYSGTFAEQYCVNNGLALTYYDQN